MKANQFLEKLTSDLTAKILCFVIALFLYLFYQLSLVDSKIVVIPLNVVQEGGVVSVGDVPSSVKVIIRTNSTDSNVINANEIRAAINLSQLIENGTYDIPVILTVDDELLKIDPLELKVKPEYISVQVEKKVTKAILLETPIIGEVAHGYSISNVTTNPKSVYVTGPESIVNATNSVLTDTVDVSDIDSERKYIVHIQQTNKMLVYESDENYETRVTLEPLEMDRDFFNVPITPLNLSDEFKIENELPSINLKIAGRMIVLENYKTNNNTVTVDLRGIEEEGEYVLPVKTKVSNYLNVVEKTFDTVTVNIIKKQVEEE